MKKLWDLHGFLDGDNKPTILGTSLTGTEAFVMSTEYRRVFGKGNIIFDMQITTYETYLKDRAEAFGKLFSALNDPMDNLIMGLKNAHKNR